MKVLLSALGNMVIAVIFAGIFTKSTIAKEIPLPKPCYEGEKSLEEAIKSRRTVRSFRSQALTLTQLSQILWAADGITADRGYIKLRAAPSAGALYPLEIFIVVGENGVKDMDAGVYHYIPDGHCLRMIGKEDVRIKVAKAALHQMWMAEAPAIMIITGEYKRCTRKYGERGIPYTYIEAGHVGQNIFLQCETLGLGAGIVGAFHNNEVIKVLGIDKRHDPITIMPVGYKR